MRLTEFEPRFIRLLEDGRSFDTANGVEDADGLMLVCPKCGGHSIVCWRPRVPLTVSPRPGRWEFHGTGFDDLSLVAGSSSVWLQSGCRAHFFVEGGAIRHAD